MLQITITLSAKATESERRVLRSLQTLISQADTVEVEEKSQPKRASLGERLQRPGAPPDLTRIVDRAAPTSHSELAVVFAYIAEVEGLPGVDASTVQRWSAEIGWDQPADWRFILANATRNDFLQRVGRGRRVLGPAGKTLITQRLSRRKNKGGAANDRVTHE